MDGENRVPKAVASRPSLGPCVVGETLRELHVLSEAQWEAIPTENRPDPAEFFPGLGWVVAGRIPGPAHRATK